VEGGQLQAIAANLLLPEQALAQRRVQQHLARGDGVGAFLEAVQATYPSEQQQEGQGQGEGQEERAEDSAGAAPMEEE
jgi:hypothetical protein